LNPSHEFNSRAIVATAPEALALAERFVSAAGLADRAELRSDEAAVYIGGPDGFGFFGTTAFRWVRVALPTTPCAVAIAVARHVLGEYWATDDEIAAEHARLPLALTMALV
jgi:hypothetical protein